MRISSINTAPANLHLRIRHEIFSGHLSKIICFTLYSPISQYRLICKYCIIWKYKLTITYLLFYYTWKLEVITIFHHL